jgi:hypothetical protein
MLSRFASATGSILLEDLGHAALAEQANGIGDVRLLKVTAFTLATERSSSSSRRMWA